MTAWVFSADHPVYSPQRLEVQFISFRLAVRLKAAPFQIQDSSYKPPERSFAPLDSRGRLSAHECFLALRFLRRPQQNLTHKRSWGLRYQRGDGVRYVFGLKHFVGILAGVRA